MIRKEKQLYKSGRKNENAYHFSPFTKKQRFLIYLSAITLIFSIIVSVLSFFDIISWGDIKNFTGIVDGVDPVESDFAVYYLNVGQSDCTIVECNDEVLMIDCGTYNQRNIIRRSLMSLNIDTIDYMLITHQHDDHFGAAATIIDNWDVENFIMPRLYQENNVSTIHYDHLLETLDKTNIKTIPVQECGNFKLGGAEVQILSPTAHSSNLNNMSVVLKITYGETVFLFQGDSEQQIEKQLLRSGVDLNADILKVGHHGSNTSTTDDFLDAVTPQCVIISAGPDNSYKHPHGKVLKRLEERNITPYITSYNGHITVSSDGNEITVSTEYANGHFYYSYS